MSIALVASASPRTDAAVLRAAWIALLSRTELSVILCASHEEPSSHDVGSVRRSLRDARRWLARVAPQAEVEIRIGATAAVAAHAARDRPAALLIVSAQDLPAPAAAIAIAREARVPVLVARRATSRPVVLAVVEHEDCDGEQVIAVASWLARATDAELHVVLVGVRDPAERPDVVLHRIPTVGDRTVGVLALADALDTDVLVVRAPTPSRWVFRARSLASRVLDDASMSVVVVPE
jgi:hypothetical protein